MKMSKYGGNASKTLRKAAQKLLKNYNMGL
jgi:hypothetical protein